MATTYPIRLADQMRGHLRSLRKARGLTQAQVGAGLGVSQARIAEIEANPGLVNFDQLLRLLAYLGCSVCLEIDAAQAQPAPPGNIPAVAQVPSHYGATPAAPASAHGAVPGKKQGSW